MKTLLKHIRNYTICEKYLPYKPKPIIQAHSHARIVILGQAPGQKVQLSGIPWDDASGNELRRWLGVSKEQFYDDKLFALMPMGFCYTGRGASGDLAPRPECAPQWHNQLWKKMPNIKLTILIGQYAQKFYLQNRLKPTLTETVKNYKDYLPKYLPLVHPSPRNRIWHRKNPWYELEVVPALQKIVLSALG
jgi:uracil-DNA glycosylase